MDITTKTEGKWKIVILSGRLDAQTSPFLETELIKYYNEGNKFIAIDLSNINYMSSAGLRILLSIRKILKGNSGTMVLLKPCAMVSEVLEMSGFSKIFFVLDDIKGLL